MFKKRSKPLRAGGEKPYLNKFGTRKVLQYVPGPTHMVSTCTPYSHLHCWDVCFHIFMFGSVLGSFHLWRNRFLFQSILLSHPLLHLSQFLQTTLVFTLLFFSSWNVFLWGKMIELKTSLTKFKTNFICSEGSLT